MGYYTNADGLIQHTGPVVEQDYLPRVTSENPMVRELVADIYFSTDGQVQSGYGLLGPNFDKDSTGGTTLDCFSDRNAFIPAGAVVLSANLLVTDAFTAGGAATLTIGTYTQAGVAIDADGFYITVAIADMTAGKCPVPSGVDTMNTSGTFDGLCVHATEDAYLKITVATGPYTAGKARLVIRYLEKA